MLSRPGKSACAVNQISAVKGLACTGPVSPRIAQIRTGKERTIGMSPPAQRILELCITPMPFALRMLPILWSHCVAVSQSSAVNSCACAGPVSPRIAQIQTGKDRIVRMTPRAKRILGLCIAAGLFALCMLSGYFLPLLSGSHMPNISREITSAPPRRLLDFTEVHYSDPPAKSS